MPSDQLSTIEIGSKVPAWFEFLIKQLHVRALTAIGCLVTVIMGNIFIFLGIHDDGMIDLKSAIIEGHFRSGAVGLGVLFLGVINSVALIIQHPANLGNRPGRDIELDLGDRGKIKITGVARMEVTLKTLQELLRGLELNKTVSGSLEQSPIVQNHGAMESGSRKASPC